jgi:LemA protein
VGARTQIISTISGAHDMTWVLIVAGAGLVVVLAWLALAYNQLVRARNAVHRTFAQIDVQLRRRHDLVPPLVETAKAYRAHEREVLEAVTAARTAAVAAESEVAAEPAAGTVATTGLLSRLAGPRTCSARASASSTSEPRPTLS